MGQMVIFENRPKSRRIQRKVVRTVPRYALLRIMLQKLIDTWRFLLNMRFALYDFCLMIINIYTFI